MRAADVTTDASSEAATHGSAPGSTCGEGLAARAPLPAHMGRLATATAAVLAAHLPMLDRTDPASAREYVIYEELIAAHQAAANASFRVAARMEACRDLAMGRHTLAPAVIAGMRAAFAEYVEAESALVTLVTAQLAADHPMLAGIERAAQAAREA